MKKDQVKVGETYRVKVSGILADVRLVGENPHGGWDGINVVTNRKVRIKSAQRLRGRTQRPGKRNKIVTLAQYEATMAPVAKKTKEATRKARPAAKRGTGEPRGQKPKRTSGLDAAAQILAEAGEALNTKTMVERMLAKGLWKTGGKTPAATIYAAILREIAAKGKDARFRKVSRGMFQLAK